jgi:hypothetical protein
MEKKIRAEYSLDLGLEIVSLDLIKENKYCLIYLGGTPVGPRIIKKYKGEDTSLVKMEAEALIFYHHLANYPEGSLIDSGEPLLNEEKNLLCIGFVEGNPFSDTLYKAIKNDFLRKQCLRSMWTLGKVIRTIREQTTLSNQTTSPFIFEYFDYCSTRLEQIPFWGKMFFRGFASQAREIAEEFRRQDQEPSFIHGDFVFKNIHVKDERLGLIDFANANYRSHPLNDIYNLRFALDNMLLPKNFKHDLLRSFFEGLGDVKFPEIVHRFYYEYHRRRWLMLKLSSRNPWDIMQGVRGLVGFAGSFDPKVVNG